MRNYNDENLLEMVEMYASEQGLIASEEELSERFDKDVMPDIIETHGEKGIPFDDDDMIREEFGYWIDSLCKSGEIHPEQYNSYGYVGKYA